MSNPIQLFKDELGSIDISKRRESMKRLVDVAKAAGPDAAPQAELDGPRGNGTGSASAPKGPRSSSGPRVVAQGAEPALISPYSA